MEARKNDERKRRRETPVSGHQPTALTATERLIWSEKSDRISAHGCAAREGITSDAFVVSQARTCAGLGVF